MPVEVRELVIKTTIDNTAGKKGPNTQQKDQDSGDIVKECVEQVMDLLKLEKER
jgi:hypothetical protein